MKETYALQIIIKTYRNFFENLGKSLYLDIPHINSAGHVVYSVVRYVDENLYKILTNKEIAKNVGYSYGHISYLFKEKTGKTLQEYIQMKKINEAIKLIRDGRFNITQIAKKLNYKTVQSFSKAFKKSIGYSPANYSKLLE